MKFALVCVALVTLASCLSPLRFETKEAEIIAKWKAENPDQLLTPEKEAELKQTARELVIKEVAAERAKAGEITGKIAGDALSGNLLGALFGAIQLGILGIGSYRKSKGAA